MVAPLIGDWSELDRLAGMLPVEGRPWFERYLRQIDIFREGASGRFGLSHFILIDGLNFAFELVGATQTYESLIDAPDMVRRAIELGFDVNLAVQRAFFARTPRLRGGTFSNMVQWVPGTVVSESVDPFHMTSVAYFEEWGRPNIERMFGSFDGGVCTSTGTGVTFGSRVHAPRAAGVWMGDDRGFPRAFDILDELRSRGATPACVQADSELRGKARPWRTHGGVSTM